jgi:hypothetical protein
LGGAVADDFDQGAEGSLEEDEAVGGAGFEGGEHSRVAEGAGAGGDEAGERGIEVVGVDGDVLPAVIGGTAGGVWGWAR